MASNHRPLIYIAYMVDADTPDSRRVGCLSTVSAQVRDFVADSIQAKAISYRNDKMPPNASPNMQKYQFLRDWERIPPAERKKVINSRLIGAVLDTAIGGRKYVPQA